MTVFEFAKALVPMGMVISASRDMRGFSVNHNLKTVTGCDCNIAIATPEKLQSMLNECKDFYENEVVR